MSDRLTKQQLKEDPLMKGTAEAADFAAHHAKLLFAGAAALVVLALVVFFVRTSGHRADDQTSGLLAEAWADYNQGNLDGAAAGLDDILDRAGGTMAGKRALLLYGDVRYDQGRYEDAETYYRRAASAFKADPLQAMAARRGLAASLENEKKYAEAAETYQTLADSAPNASLRAQLRLDVARNALKAGDRDQALSIYGELAENADNPQAAQEAKLRLAELQAAQSG